MILSTHIVSDVESIATEIAVMKDGRASHDGRAGNIAAHVRKATSGKAWFLRRNSIGCGRR